MRKMIACGLLMGIHSNALSVTWAELLKEKEMLFKQHPELDIIKRQQAAFECGEAPTIVHKDIKSISIAENGEYLVDLKQIKGLSITMMPDPAMPFENDTCNSGLPSASKMRASVFENLSKMNEYLDSFCRDFGYKPGHVVIKVFEGLRDLKTQEMLFNNKKAEIMAANAQMTDEQADAETSKWVSPVKNNVPVHSTGAAVDIRLWHKDKKEFLDLGKFGVIWGANPSVPTYTEDITDTQKRNRLYFQMAAAKAGLTNYPYEYWHVSSGDRYAAYWNEADPTKRIARYGSIQ